MTDVYLDAGMLRAATALTAGKNDVGLRVSNAEYRGNKAEESAALAPLLKNRDMYGPGRIRQLTDVGRLRDAWTMLAVGKKNWPPELVHVASGYVELAQGDIPHSIDDLRKGAAGYANDHSPALSAVVDHLATALERAGRTDQALRVLVDCETQIAAQGDEYFVHHYNLKARWHLARLYRQTGHLAEAEEVENALRAQLKLADPDHAIARALKLQPAPYESAAVH